MLFRLSGNANCKLILRIISGALITYFWFDFVAELSLATGGALSAAVTLRFPRAVVWRHTALPCVPIGSRLCYRTTCLI